MKLDRLFIDAALDRDPEIEYLIAKTGLEPEPVPDSRPVYDIINRSEDPVSFAKTLLYITTNRGAVVRECRGIRTALFEA